MPVRIYEIAKKLNLESKVVLAKARELGIHVAKVPSSSLDKITAEYLEQQMTPLARTASAAVAPAEPTPVLLIPAPEPEFETQPQDDFPADAPGQQEETDGTQESAESAGTRAAQGFSAEAAGVSGSELESAPSPALGETEAPGPGEASFSDAGTASPGSLADAPSPASPGGTTVPVSPTPSRPGLGEKIGSIDLSKFSYRRPGAQAPADPRGRDARPDQRGTPPARPGQTPPRPPGAQPGTRPATPGAAQQPARPGGQQQFGRLGSPQQSHRPGGPAGRTGGSQSGRPGGSQQTGRPGPYQRNFPPGPPRPPAPAKPYLALDAPVIQLRPPIIVRELAEKMGRKPFQIIADLMQMGVFATVTQTIDPEAAVKVCAKNGFKFETEKRDKTAHTINVPQDQKVELDQEDLDTDQQPRAPVVTIMGHVDHGKTSLLDVIRKSDVVSGEAGGITQHIGAYTISHPHPARKEETMRITFLDTPGHAAFSAMRARGANVTDIVVLVVAANDGVMPQTLEALAHAQAAKVPIIVAVNKCDHPAANPMRVKQQLQDRGLVPDDWGGDTLYVECSAITKQGVDKLIENILLQAELMELKANAKRNAKGNVIESGVEPGGPVATVLVRKGTLHIGDVIICGEHYGRVRAMMDEDGRRLKEAGPSDAVRVLGLNGVPEAGFEFSAVDNEKAARELAGVRGEQRKRSELDGVRPRRTTLEDIFTNIHQMSAKVLKVIVKADTQGSVEAICEALRKTENEQVQLEIIHSAVGAIKESDVYLASSADAVILGFHSRVDSSAAETAKREGVQIKLYAIIYELIDHVKEALAGLLDPLLKETIVGQAEVRKVFELSKGGNVAGCAVTLGRLVRGKLRVRRRNNIIYEGVSQTLKRFQDDVNEVRAGLECGIRLEGFDDFQEGDLIECYSVEKIAQKLT